MLTTDQRGYFGIHLIAISQKILKIFIIEMSLKFTNLILQSNAPGTNELNIIFTERTHVVLEQKNPELCQYHGYWLYGSLHRQAINSHGIGCVG